jgi:predicted metalloprotease with PDZ domain
MLYPAVVPASQVKVRARLQLPEGWKYGTSLDIETADGAAVAFAPVRLDTLVDSPVLAGLNFRSIELSAEGASHAIDIAADSEAGLAISEQSIAGARSLVIQARSLFGRAHFTRYRFLVAASDFTAQGGGIEHGASTDIRVPELFFRSPALERSRFYFFAHEYAHSWNGVFRIPAGHVVKDFQQPLRSDLLWVYEGLTSYLGDVLGVRSGAASPEYLREYLALVAAGCATRSGRLWRSVQDTADAASATMAAGFSVPTGWDSRHRTADYYDEGTLIWLEADALIRQRSGGARSLDDFARDFLGAGGQFPGVKSYVAGDVYDALNRLAPMDWQAFFQRKLTSLTASPPVAGLTEAGWRLVFTEEPNEYMTDVATRLSSVDMRFTLGLVISPDGNVLDVIDGAPAAAAGLFPGERVRSVNGRPFSLTLLEQTIGKPGRADAIAIVTSFAGFERTHSVAYGGGHRYPHLERIPDRPDLLATIVSPR